MKMWIALFVLIIVSGFLYAWFIRKPAKAVLTVHGAHYNVDLAKDALAQAHGLSGREIMAPDEGMLFVFTQPMPRYFWMNDMRFPLDFLWIRDRKVIGIAENVPHPAANKGEIYRLNSPEPADMVLELNAGQIAAQGIQVGDIIRLDEPVSQVSLDSKG